MSTGEVVVRQDDLPAIADDYLIQVADQAERRIDAVIKIKKVAMKVTNPRDWTDQNGNPYLQVSGSEKIANLFNISWRIEEPRCEEEPDGHFTYSIKGEFSLGGRTIEVEGTRSSKDGFFKKYEYPKDKPRVELPPSAIDKGDVKKAAMTNLFGNGITRILGIRNLTWEDLQEFAGITKESVASVSYRKEGESGIQPPQSKSAEIESIDSVIEKVEKKTGKKKDGTEWTKYVITAGGIQFNTFDRNLADEANKSAANSVILTLDYTATKFGNDLKALKNTQPEMPNA